LAVLSSSKILIVEDEMLVALAMRLALDALGYQTVGIAPDLSTAVKLTDERPDLALVDLNLRDGLTGPQIGELLSRQRVAVLFVTANPRLLGDGIDGTIGVLTKPTDKDALEKAVAYALRVAAGDQHVTPPPQLTVFRRAGGW
jgi:two-component system, response regulator PdtaR